MKPRRLIEAEPEAPNAQPSRAVLRRLIAVEERLTAIEARLPPVPSPPSPGWLIVKRATDVLHRAETTIYAWARSGKINFVKHNGIIYVDPSSVN